MDNTQANRPSDDVSKVLDDLVTGEQVAGAKNRVVKNVRLSHDLVLLIERYKARERYWTFTQALEKLLRVAVRVEDVK